MAETAGVTSFPVGLSRIEEHKLRGSASFFSHIVRVGAEVLEKGGWIEDSESTGWVRAVCDLQTLSTLQKIPKNIESFLEEWWSPDQSIRNISIHIAKLAGKSCNIFTISQLYDLNIPGCNSCISETLITWKLGFNFIKSTLKIWKNAEETEGWSDVRTIKIVNHSVHAVSQCYRLAVFTLGIEKSNNFLLICRITGIALDCMIAWQKVEDTPKERVPIIKSTADMWGSNTSFVKYGTASVTGTLNAVGLIGGNGRDGIALAASDLHTLGKMQRVAFEPLQLYKSVRKNDLYQSGKNFTSCGKNACAVLRTANKYNAWLPQFLKFSTPLLSRLKLRFEVVNSLFGSISSSKDVLWRKKRDEATLSKMWFTVNLTTCLAYLNYAQYFKKQKSSIFLLALGINGVAASISLAYYNANKGRPSRSDDS